ncbi:MAG: hypothetical protein OJI67_10220, partial [Prosthecobacter sp.]|nr:hypothetical protein [Prosthecobacter sp.]
KTLDEARTRFLSQYNPAKNWTHSLVEPGLDQDSNLLYYVITLDDSFWSPPVLVHQMWESWEIDKQFSDRKFQIKVGDKSYNVSSDTLPRLQAGQEIRFALAHGNDRQNIPKIRLNIKLK